MAKSKSKIAPRVDVMAKTVIFPNGKTSNSGKKLKAAITSCPTSE